MLACLHDVNHATVHEALNQEFLRLPDARHGASPVPLYKENTHNKNNNDNDLYSSLLHKEVSVIDGANLTTVDNNQHNHCNRESTTTISSDIQMHEDDVSTIMDEDQESIQVLVNLEKDLDTYLRSSSDVENDSELCSESKGESTYKNLIAQDSSSYNDLDHVFLHILPKFPAATPKTMSSQHDEHLGMLIWYAFHKVFTSVFISRSDF